MHLAPASSSAPRQRIVTIILTMFGLLIVAIVANMSFFSYRLNSQLREQQFPFCPQVSPLEWH